MKEYIFEAEKVDWLGAYHVNAVKGELIRCKDCKYYDNISEDKPYCNRLVMHMDGNDNWFCGDAVRKEE